MAWTVCCWAAQRGQSTLLNLLAGFDRAIVTPVAGTTRDIVEQAVQLGSVRLNLFDTAGVREVGADGDAIEAEASAAAGASSTRPDWCWPCSTPHSRCLMMIWSWPADARAARPSRS